MKLQKLLLFAFFSLFLLANVSAVVLETSWQNNLKDITINYGGTAVFDIYSATANPPLTIKAQLLNSLGNSVYTFQNEVIPDYAHVGYVVINPIYSINNSIYQTSGNFKVRIDYSDAFQSNTTFLNLIVNPIQPPTNSPPIITTIPNQIINENTSYSYQVNASDPDGDHITYSLSLTTPSWLSISSSGLITGMTPSVNVDTTFIIGVQVSDGINITTQDYLLLIKNIPDTIPPIVTLNSPINNFNSTSSLITFNGTVSDNVGISNVTLYILNGITNQISFSGLNNTNYLFTLNLSDGIYSWNYRACDTSGNCAFSPANNILVINTSSQNQTNLQIHFVSPTPTDGSVSQNSIPINITTSNSSSVVNITVYLYDSSRRLVNTFGQVNSSLFTFNMTPNSGTYYINATAFDNAGNSNSTETRMIILQLSNNNNNNGNQNSEVSTGYSYIDVYQNQPPQINRTSPEIITEQPTNSNTISLGFVILLFEIFLVLIVLGIIILVFAKRKFRD